MPAFPDAIEPSDVSGVSVPGHLRSTGDTGGTHVRDQGGRGYQWTEAWGRLNARDHDARKLVAFIERAHQHGTIFDKLMPVEPGSGFPPFGSGASGVTVNGAGQSGSSIALQGFDANDPLAVGEGDLLAIAGLDYRFKATADVASDGSGLATVPITPFIPAGSEPNGGAAVTLTGVTLRCTVEEYTGPPNFRGNVMTDLQVRFREQFV